MPGRLGTTDAMAPSVVVRHVVEARHVDVAGDREPPEQLVPINGRAAGALFVLLPLADDLGDRQHDLLAVAEHGGVEEVGDRLRVERRVPAGQHDRVLVGAVLRVQRDARQVERVEHVGVAELGGEAQAEHVEGGDRSVAVDRELRDCPKIITVAHHLLHVGPHRVGALGEDPVALVEHLVEDLDALVGQADLVGVGVHQRPPDLDGVPVLDDGVQLAADVLDRLGDRRQARLQAGEQGLGHDKTLRVLGGQGTRVRTTLTACTPCAHRSPSTAAGSSRAAPRWWWTATGSSASRRSAATSPRAARWRRTTERCCRG